MHGAMQVRKAVEGDFDELVALYQAIGAAVAGTDNDPIWEVGVYPTYEELSSHIAGGEAYPDYQGDFAFFEKEL